MESVFHLSMPSVSFTSRFSSNSLIIGSDPAAYFTSSPGNWSGLSLLTNAWTWGYLPNFHPHTISWANAYVGFSRCEVSESGWQQLLQVSSSGSRWNCDNSLQELQSRCDDEKPLVRQTSALSSWHHVTITEKLSSSNAVIPGSGSIDKHESR